MKSTTRGAAALALLAAVAALSGCGAIKELEAKQLEADRNQCANYGFAPATDAFASCMLRIDTERKRAWAEADRRRAAEAAAANQQKQDPARMDCKTTEVVTSSSDGSSSTTKTRTTCVGM